MIHLVGRIDGHRPCPVSVAGVVRRLGELRRAARGRAGVRVRRRSRPHDGRGAGVAAQHVRQHGGRGDHRRRGAGGEPEPLLLFACIGAEQPWNLRAAYPSDWRDYAGNPFDIAVYGAWPPTGYTLAESTAIAARTLATRRWRSRRRGTNRRWRGSTTRATRRGGASTPTSPHWWSNVAALSAMLVQRVVAAEHGSAGLGAAAGGRPPPLYVYQHTYALAGTALGVSVGLAVVDALAGAVATVLADVAAAGVAVGAAA